jgi:hypothetical protein
MSVTAALRRFFAEGVVSQLESSTLVSRFLSAKVSMHNLFFKHVWVEFQCTYAHDPVANVLLKSDMLSAMPAREI